MDGRSRSTNGSTMDGRWSSGLLMCGEDIGICSVTCLCPPVNYGQISHKMGGNCCIDGLTCMVMACVGLSCVVHIPLRNRIRHQYGIGDDCPLCPAESGCLVTYFMPQCAICQEARHLVQSQDTLPWQQRRSPTLRNSPPIQPTQIEHSLSSLPPPPLPVFNPPSPVRMLPELVASSPNSRTKEQEKEEAGCRIQ